MTASGGDDGEGGVRAETWSPLTQDYKQLSAYATLSIPAVSLAGVGWLLFTHFSGTRFYFPDGLKPSEIRAYYVFGVIFIGVASLAMARLTSWLHRFDGVRSNVQDSRQAEYGQLGSPSKTDALLEVGNALRDYGGDTFRYAVIAATVVLYYVVANINCLKGASVVDGAGAVFACVYVVAVAAAIELPAIVVLLQCPRGKPAGSALVFHPPVDPSPPDPLRLESVPALVGEARTGAVPRPHTSRKRHKKRRK